MANKVKNRIKVILVEKDKSSKWLAEMLGLNPSTVSRWCTNDVQPSLERLSKVASLLNVDIKDLLSSTK